MRVQAGLRAQDWEHWGQRTTFKSNAAELLRRSLRPHQAIYCSPLTDPYQPAEADRRLMPGVLEAVAANPPAVFVIQTRGPLILRDIGLIGRGRPENPSSHQLFDHHRSRGRAADLGTALRTDRRTLAHGGGAAGRRNRDMRNPGADPPLQSGGSHQRALEVSAGPVIADPLHIRATKRSGATTRGAAIAICRRQGWTEWLDPAFQQSVLDRMRTVAQAAGREFGYGPKGFGLLAKALF